jgi:inhibitor of cysteine peptidase
MSKEGLMKRVLILVAVVVLTLGLVAGCVGVKTYKDVGENIDISVGQEFIIALGSNPTTGYSWQASYDDTMLQLVESTYEPEETDENVVGGGGTEFFRFKALAAGEVEITMTYAQPWEGGGVGETQVFTGTIE